MYIYILAVFTMLMKAEKHYHSLKRVHFRVTFGVHKKTCFMFLFFLAVAIHNFVEINKQSKYNVLWFYNNIDNCHIRTSWVAFLRLRLVKRCKPHMWQSRLLPLSKTLQNALKAPLISHYFFILSHDLWQLSDIDSGLSVSF